MSKYVATGAYTDDDAYTVIVDLGVYDTEELAVAECVSFEEEQDTEYGREAVTTIVEVCV